MVVLASGGQLGVIGSYCFYCGRPVRKWKQRMYERPPVDMVTEDHVVPQCRGGKNGKTVTACLECNQDKYRLSLEEFRVVRAFRAGLLPVPDYKFAAEQRV